MIKAIERFRELELGIKTIIRATDVYAIHVMSRLRNQDVDMVGINAILSGKKMSGFNLLGETYSKDEKAYLEAQGHFKAIGQQIIVATHTALESYLILKFKEYYRFKMNGGDPKILEKTENDFKFGCLDDFKRQYKKYFSIHLPLFEIEFFTSNGCNFKPKKSWDAIQLIDRSRHEIVHKGFLDSYKVSTLMDSWYPFEFVQGWVLSFDAVFDSYVYKGQKTPLYVEYLRKVHASGSSL